MRESGRAGALLARNARSLSEVTRRSNPDEAVEVRSPRQFGYSHLKGAAGACGGRGWYGY
jgi:hypothetical protein